MRWPPYLRERKRRGRGEEGERKGRAGVVGERGDREVGEREGEAKRVGGGFIVLFSLAKTSRL